MFQCPKGLDSKFRVRRMSVLAEKREGFGRNDSLETLASQNFGQVSGYKNYLLHWAEVQHQITDHRRRGNPHLNIRVSDEDK